MASRTLTKAGKESVLKNVKKAQAAASTPEARAKAVATMRRRRAEKMAKLQEQGDFKSPSEGTIPLDAIPDREPRKKYKRKAPTEIVGNADARVALALELAKMFNKLIGETK